MVAVAHPPRRRYTPQEYLELERAAEFKSEYLGGYIYAMAGGSPEHNTVLSNTHIEVGSQLKSTGCRTYVTEQKICIPSEELYTYPDVSIVCGEPLFHEEHRDVLTNPKVIIEVLSPSTEDYDRGRKFTRYQEIASLTDYILISQDRPRIDHCERKGEGQWLISTYIGLDTEVHIESIGCVLRMREIYDLVEFPKPKSEEETTS